MDLTFQQLRAMIHVAITTAAIALAAWLMRTLLALLRTVTVLGPGAR